MRGLVAGLESPHELADALPGLYREPDAPTVDDAEAVRELVDAGLSVPEVARRLRRPPEWVQSRLELGRTPALRTSLAERFTRALDDALAPVHAALDSLPAYFDPQLTPPDFLDWLAGWVGLTLDETWPLDRRRSLVASAVALYARRGTARGLAEHVHIFTGVEPQVEESGGVAWSTTPGAPFPGERRPRVVVRVAAEAGQGVDVARLKALVDAVKPAHVPASVEVSFPELEEAAA
jgi:phage tail-like protein